MGSHMVSSAEMARKWHVSERRVTELCRNGRVHGAEKLSFCWLIPDDAKKPQDGRRTRDSTAGKIPAIEYNSNCYYNVNTMKPLPVGLSNYKRAFADYHVVDKTLLIRDIIDSASIATLVTRPRRFGKTLNMSMLRAFFEATEESPARYFHGTNIWSCGERYLSQMGKYPVVSLTFKDVKAGSWAEASSLINSQIRSVCDEHREIVKAETIIESEAGRSFKRLLQDEANEADYAGSIRTLCKLLHKSTGSLVIVLIDEYDTPIEQGHLHGYYNEVVAFMRKLLGSALKDNDDLKFGFLTGILRVAKEGVFSGLNNIQVFTVLDDHYSEYYGFTPEEVKELTKYYEVAKSYDELCSWYDGYRFGNSEIFNPWSVISFLSEKGMPRPYWVNTGESPILKELIRRADADTSQKLRCLIEGGVISVQVNLSAVYPQLHESSTSVFSFLLMAGYLTTEGAFNAGAYNGSYRVKLRIPNREVSEAYRHDVLETLCEGVNSCDPYALQDALTEGDGAALQEELRLFLGSVVSYFDTANESFFHGLMLSLCAVFGPNYRVVSNRESGLGRFDIQMTPRGENANSLPGIILELKVGHQVEGQSLAMLAQEAIEQTERCDYTNDLRNQGVSRIISYGVAFSGKSASVEVKELKVAHV